MEATERAPFSVNGFQSSTDIRVLVQQKEKELRDINEYRISALEAVLAQKDNEVDDLRFKLSKVKDDFQYNLTLIRERDAELEAFEVSAAQARDREAAISSELEAVKAQLSKSRAASESDRIKVAEMEAWYKQQVVAMRETVEAARAARTDELQGWRTQLEAARTEAAARVHAVEADAERSKSGLREAAEAALMAAQREHRRKDEDSAAAIQMADERASAALSQVREASREVSALRNVVEAARVDAREADADATAARAQLDAARVEFENALAAAIRERDTAVASRSSLLEEYERRMAGLLESLGAVEQAFKDQKADGESKVAEAAAKATADARQTIASAAAREATLQSRLREAESSCRLATLDADDARVQAEGSNARAVQAEAVVERLQRELAGVKEGSAAQTTRLSAQLQASRAELHDAQETEDGREGKLARLEAELAAAATRAEQAEKLLRDDGSAWHARWSEREAELHRLYDNDMHSLRQQRDSLAQRLAEARPNTAFAKSVPSPGQDGDDLILVGDVGAAGIVTLQGSTRVEPVLHQLSILEDDLRRAKEEAARFLSDAQTARQELAAFQASRWMGQHDISLLPDSDSPESPALLALRLELSASQARCTELDENDKRLRGFISDMRSHIEELQGDFATVQTQLEEARAQYSAALAALVAATAARAQPIPVQVEPTEGLAEALAYKASAETMLSNVYQERDVLIVDLNRAQTYIALLQRRLGQARDAADQNIMVVDSGSLAIADEECSMLRAHSVELQEQVSSLRLQLRDTAAQLAARQGNEALWSQAPQAAGRSEIGQLQRVNELVLERDALLELSNSLRAQLHRAQGQAKSAAHPVSAVRSAQSSDDMAADRASKLEAALSRVTAQNNSLQTDMQRLMAQLDRQGHVQPLANLESSDASGTKTGAAPAHSVAVQSAKPPAAPPVGPSSMGSVPLSQQAVLQSGSSQLGARNRPSGNEMHAPGPTAMGNPWESAQEGRKEAMDLSVSGRAPAMHSPPVATTSVKGAAKVGVPRQVSSGRRPSSGQAVLERSDETFLSIGTVSAPPGVRQIAEAKASALGKSGVSRPGGAPAWLKPRDG